MNKYSRAQLSVGWNYLSIPKVLTRYKAYQMQVVE